MKIEHLEQRFLEVTNLQADLTTYPITTDATYARRIENKTLGEVFTPPKIIDKMIDLTTLQPHTKVLDLCAGRGQYAIRMARKLHNYFPTFNLDLWLKEKLWFNELKISNCLDILYIFGNDINLLIGDAREISTAPDIKGIQWFNGTHWQPIEPEEVKGLLIEKKKSERSLF